MEAYGKDNNMTSKSIGDPGMVSPSLFGNRRSEGNNGGNTDPEHIKDI